MDTSSIIQPNVTPVFWTDHKVRSYRRVSRPGGLSFPPARSNQVLCADQDH